VATFAMASNEVQPFEQGDTSATEAARQNPSGGRVATAAA
jgi:hypothetical protein